MPTFRKTLDVYQGYNYKKDKMTPVGFITKLKLGDTDLTADQTCKDPTNPTTDVKAVAVLGDIQWETGVTDAVYFSGQVSITNKQNIATLVYNSMTNVLAEFQFSIYEYDPLAKKYYLCFHSNKTDMKGILEKRGEDLNLAVNDDPSTEVQSPENYGFMTGIKPQPTAQALQVAVGDGKNFAKAWGLTVG
ncbi:MULTISPECIES: hypothetical protein [Sorangium]|uniref:Phage tail protein n=1 Tax=Sorangium cellulosum TaxID=56 RepID=A0A4P2QGW1_SORCE|nr:MULTISPECIES: hypothetical protein [Sorangium]AUX29124.1 hypothetical protein SOCE836_012110 [Sorangium cellulosum]WCQ88515.1 hypothetical protein NQZ70_01193 [Sorangium sp. Soce836]